MTIPDVNNNIAIFFIIPLQSHIFFRHDFRLTEDFYLLLAKMNF